MRYNLTFTGARHVGRGRDADRTVAAERLAPGRADTLGLEIEVLRPLDALPTQRCANPNAEIWVAVAASARDLPL